MTTDQKPEERTDINQLGEFGLIEHLTKGIVLRNRENTRGIGDDAAVFTCDERRSGVLSTDLLLEGIHFDLAYVPLRHLGFKAVAVNVSDILAMNAQPSSITVSLGLSNRFSVEALEEFYEGVAHACERFGVDLIGGDTSSSVSGLVISITALGYAATEKIVYRNGASKGDILFVTGDLGAAYLGLQILEREKQIFQENPEVQPDLEGEDYLIRRQLYPELHPDLGELLEEFGVTPTAMIDISDGLSSELMHISTQSGVGCRIEEADIPISQDAYQRALKFNLDPIVCALHGGEDYEILFTVPAEQAHLLEDVDWIHQIGLCTAAGDGLTMRSKSGKIHPLTAQGWKHV